MDGEIRAEELEKIITEFLKNRAKQGESTATRHIHRRFDIPIDKAEEIMASLSEKKLVEEYYDNEYQEKRYRIK
jgi:hypothetical protein